MCKANRIGLVPKKIMVTRGGRTFMQTVYINPNQDTPQAPTTKVDFGEFERLKKLDRAKALKYLIELGVTWKESENPGINLMRASMAAKKASGGVESELTVNLPKEVLAPTLRPSKQMRERDLQEILAKLNPIEFDLLDRKSKVQLLKKELGTDGVRQLAEKLNLNWLHNDHPSVDYMRLSMALAEWIKDKTMNQLRLYSTYREPINVTEASPEKLAEEVADKNSIITLPEDTPKRIQNLATAINKIKSLTEFKAFLKLGIVPEDDDAKSYLMNTLIPQVSQQTGSLKTENTYELGKKNIPGNPVNQTLWAGLHKATKLPTKVFTNGGIVRDMFESQSLSNITYTAPRATLTFPEVITREFATRAIIQDDQYGKTIEPRNYVSSVLSSQQAYVRESMVDFEPNTETVTQMFKPMIQQYGEGHNILQLMKSLHNQYSSYKPTKELLGPGNGDLDSEGFVSITKMSSTTTVDLMQKLQESVRGYIAEVTPPSVAKAVFNEKHDGFLKVLDFISSKDKSLATQVKDLKAKYKELLEHTGYSFSTLEYVLMYYANSPKNMFSNNYRYGDKTINLRNSKEQLEKELEENTLKYRMEAQLQQSRAWKELIMKLWGEEDGKALINNYIIGNRHVDVERLFIFDNNTALTGYSLETDFGASDKYKTRLRIYTPTDSSAIHKEFPKKALLDNVPGTNTPVWKWMAQNGLTTDWFAPDDDGIARLQNDGSVTHQEKTFAKLIDIDEYKRSKKSSYQSWDYSPQVYAGRVLSEEQETYLRETAKLLTLDNRDKVIGLLQDIFGIKYEAKSTEETIVTGGSRSETKVVPTAEYRVVENGENEELDTVISNLLTIYKQENFFKEYAGTLATRLTGEKAKNFDTSFDRLIHTKSSYSTPFITFSDAEADETMKKYRAYGSRHDSFRESAYTSATEALDAFVKQKSTKDMYSNANRSGFITAYRPEIVSGMNVYNRNSEEGKFYHLNDWNRIVEQQLRETPIVTNEKRKEIKKDLVGYTKENVDRLKQSLFFMGQTPKEYKGVDSFRLRNNILTPSVNMDSIDKDKIKWEYISHPTVGTSVWYDTVDSGTDTADTVPLNHPLFPQLQKTFLNILQHTPRAEVKARSKKQKELSVDELYWRKLSDIYGLTDESIEDPKLNTITKQDREQMLSKVKCSLAKVPEEKQASLFHKIKMDWDQKVHGRNSAHLYGAYEVKNLELEEEYQNAAKVVAPEPEQYYHGTSYGATAGILGQSGRFRVPKSNAEVVSGAMLGYGVYLAKKSSKSAQYVSNYNYSRHGDGTLFLCDVIMGKKVRYGDFGWGSVTSGDTVEALTENTRLANDEWCVRKEEYVLPRYLINMANKSRF